MARGGSRRWWHATARRCCAWRTSSRSATTTRSTPTSAGSRSTCAGWTPSIAATEGAWLRVVVKHEAMAIRRARQESVDRDDVDLDESVPPGCATVEDVLAGGERVDRSVEALRALKPDEARALLLKAEGLSYQEIGKRFGWTYTKVNRSITEGRKRFLNVFGEIESGEACEAYGEVLSALATGTATSAQVVSIRPHLRHCAACRATVREMRFSRARRLALFGAVRVARAAALATGGLRRLDRRRPVRPGGGRARAVPERRRGRDVRDDRRDPGGRPLIAAVDAKPEPKPPKKTAKPKRKATKRATPAPTPVATVALRRRARRRRHRPKPAPKPPSQGAAAREEEARRARASSGFEAKAPTALVHAGRRSRPRVSSVGGRRRRARGGGSAPAGTPGGEFGFEGG